MKQHSNAQSTRGYTLRKAGLWKAFPRSLFPLHGGSKTRKDAIQSQTIVNGCPNTLYSDNISFFFIKQKVLTLIQILCSSK